MSDDLVARLNVVLATLERGDILMIAQEDDCRWIRDAKAEIERLRAALALALHALKMDAPHRSEIEEIEAALSPLPAPKGGTVD